MFDLKPFTCQPWLAEPSRFQLMLAAAAGRKVPSVRQVEKQAVKRMEQAPKLAAAKAVRAVKGRVGVINISGIIEQHMTWMSMFLGGISCDEIAAQFDYLMSDPSIEAIVLHIDSPGGSTYGVEELGDKIYNARAKKPIYSIANSMAGSAAYWLATAAQTVCCTPGGDVGGVGVYAVHVSKKEAMKQAGIKVTLISAGRYKTEGNPYDDMDEEGAAYAQVGVDETYSKFVATLSRNRHEVSKADVRAKFGEGRMVSADAALAAKMIDQVCTFESLMQRLTGIGPASSARAIAGPTKAVLMARQMHRERAAMSN